METAFHYDPKEKHLSFLLRENVTADPDIQLRLRGRLNTATADLEYHATAQKFLSTGTAIKVRSHMLMSHTLVYNWPTLGGRTQCVHTQQACLGNSSRTREGLSCPRAQAVAASFSDATQSSKLSATLSLLCCHRTP